MTDHVDKSEPQQQSCLCAHSGVDPGGSLPALHSFVLCGLPSVYLTTQLNHLLLFPLGCKIGMVSLPYIYFSNLDLGPEEDLPRDEKIEDGEDKSWGQEALYKLSNAKQV